MLQNAFLTLEMGQILSPLTLIKQNWKKKALDLLKLLIFLMPSKTLHLKEMLTLEMVCNSLNINIAELMINLTDICITDFLLALEIIGDGEEPCPASGLTSTDIHTQDKKLEHGEDSHHFVAWLLEEHRRTCTHKRSGTNQHPSHNHSQVGNVKTAFVHFVYLYSYESVVLADI